MKELPTNIPALRYRFVAPHDTSFFALAGALRLAVRARVKDEQRVGVLSHHWLGNLPRADASNYDALPPAATVDQRELK